MQQFVQVGYRMAFPRSEGWITAHNVRRVLTRCLLLGAALSAGMGLAYDSGKAAATGLVLGLAWFAPSAVELWAERERAAQSLRWAFAAGLVALIASALALLQLGYTLHTLSGKTGSYWAGKLDPEQVPLALLATVVATLAGYYRLRALVGNPLPDLLSLAMGLSAIVGVPMLWGAAASDSGVVVFGVLLFCGQLALGAAVASLPLVVIAYWSDWLCERYQLATA